MYELDGLDRAILMELQRGIPITSRPYADMAEVIGNTTEEEVIRRIDNLKKGNIIRRMSGFFNSHALGYKSTLVGVRPKEGRFQDATAVINAYPGVTHNYKRSHHYSIWFTLIAINRPTMEYILDQIEADDSIEEMLRFEMTKRYKIDVTFDLNAPKEENDRASSNATPE